MKNDTSIPVYEMANFGSTVKSSDFLLDRLENLIDLPLPFPHRHDFYQVLWMTRSRGIHIIDFYNHPVKDNTLFFMAPGQIHSWDLSNDTAGYVINFSAEFFLLTLQNKNVLAEVPFFQSAKDAALHLTTEQAAVLGKTMASLEEEAMSIQPNADILRSYFHIFLIQSWRFYNPAETENNTSPSFLLTKKFRSLIEQHFLSQTSAQAYAALLKVTERHLCDATKKTIGKTASELIHERVLLEAKRLLIHSELGISEIAFKLNFDDPAYFSRFFKKGTGQSPGEFKKTCVEKPTCL